LNEQASIPDIAVILPLVIFLLPDYQVFAPVEYVPIRTSEHVAPDLKGKFIVPFYLDRFTLRGLDPHIEGSLPEGLDGAFAGHEVAVGREELPLLCEPTGESGCIVPIEGR
jgi:hypothetical protein